jgi:transcriptional regulator with XRE-family HTH domain
MTPRDLGVRLAAARHAAGLSQQQAAARLFMAQSCVSRIETGTRDVTAIDAARMAALYDVPLASLFEAQLDTARRSSASI